MTTGIETNPTDAIVDGGIMPMTPVHFQGLPMSNTGGMIRARFLSADPQRILGIQIFHPMVLHIHLWHTIIGGG